MCALAWAAIAAHAGFDSLRYCDRGPALSAAQQDRLLRFAAIVRGELESAGVSMAIVSRSGVNLERFQECHRRFLALARKKLVIPVPTAHSGS